MDPGTFSAPVFLKKLQSSLDLLLSLAPQIGITLIFIDLLQVLFDLLILVLYFSFLFTKVLIIGIVFVIHNRAKFFVICIGHASLFDTEIHQVHLIEVATRVSLHSPLVTTILRHRVIWIIHLRCSSFWIEIFELLAMLLELCSHELLMVLLCPMIDLIRVLFMF